LPEKSGESPFCPQCGAPQLNLSLENQSVEASGEALEGESSLGKVTPVNAKQVEWKTAIRCAVVVAAVGAALSVCAIRVDLLTSVSFLWIMSASLITLGFYQKRSPTAWMDAGVGARIGVVVGICLALELAIALAGAGLVARFGMHAMGTFDAQMTAQILQMQKTMQQQTTPVPEEYLRFINSLEFRAGIMLTTFTFVSVGLVVLSVLGGAFHGLLRMRRRPAI